MKELLEQMIWAWIWDMINTRHKNEGTTVQQLQVIMDEAEEKCLKPLKEKGVIGIYKTSLSRKGNQLVLFVEVATLGPALSGTKTEEVSAVVP